ncbi:hypothetical protein HDV06_001068 [Boothiomyces sp. JEL0866]|nr:hypothetical protein HDV06_001068 [Boothiomyces sp. JEL0866]
MSSLACCEGFVDSGTPTGNEQIINGVKCYVSEPKEHNKKAIILATDVFGFKVPNIRLMADAYAELGYLCIIPDFFNGTQAPADLMGDLNKMEDKDSTISQKLYTVGRCLYHFPKFLLLNSQNHSIKMVKSLIPHLKQTNTKVGVQGFCWGGKVSVYIAHEELADACVACHAGILSVPKDIEKIKTPTFFINAEIDTLLSVDQAKQIENIMNGKQGGAKLYPGVKHGFAVRGDENDEHVRKQRAEAFDDACYVAKPSNPNSHAVVIATDVFGFKLPNVRLIADSFAKEGFYAVVPDLFNNTEPPPDFMDDVEKAYSIGRLLIYYPYFIIFNSPASGIKIVKTVLEDVRKNHKKVGIQGYCWGGRIAALLAQEEDAIDAACPAHAGGLNYPDDIEKIKKPTFFVNAEIDMSMTGEQAKSISEIMQKKGDEFGSKLYPGVKHGFAVRGNENDEHVKKQRVEAFSDALLFLFLVQDCNLASVEPATGTPTGQEESINGVPCYIAKPVKPNSHAIVLATDIFGYTLTNSRLIADSFAKEGYYCIVPDLFNGTEPPADVMYSFDHLMSKILWYGPKFLLLNSAASGIKVIEKILPSVRQDHSKVAVQGYCWGGKIAVLMAHQQGLIDAATAAHAGGLKYPNDIQNIATPTFFMNAENDHAITVQQKEVIERIMNEKGSKFASKIYPGVKHGFAVRGDENDANVRQQRAQAFLDSIAYYKTVLQ